MGYRWATPDDGRKMLGWIAAAIVGGALEWRPHLLLTAPAAQGKSWLLREVVQKLMGPLVIRIADATPAALARLTSDESLAIVIDEAEPSSDWVMDLLKLLRVSSGADGLRVRADSGSDGVVVQEPRFACMLSATAKPRLNRADASRLIPVRFGGKVEDWPAVQRDIRRNMGQASRVRARFVREAEAIADLAADVTERLQERGVDSREALASGALTAGWAAWGINTDDVLAYSDSNVQTDAADLLFDLLALRERHQSGVDKSILELLSSMPTAWNKTIADLYGIRRHEDGLLIDTANKGLKAKLVRTAWERVDLKQMLLQMDGTVWVDRLVTFGARRARAVSVPADALAQVGVTLAPVAEEPEAPS